MVWWDGTGACGVSAPEMLGGVAVLPRLVWPRGFSTSMTALVWFPCAVYNRRDRTGLCVYQTFGNLAGVSDHEVIRMDGARKGAGRCSLGYICHNRLKPVRFMYFK